MKTAKTSKRALLCSVLSIALCLSMLIGTTFAWFTDTATTSVNQIKSGNLEIEFQYATAWDTDGNPTTWADAEGETLPFLVEGKIPAKGTQILWEPGCTYYTPEVRVLNKGNLAVKIEYLPTALGVTGKLAEVLEPVFKNPTDAEGNDINIEPKVLLPGEASPAWSFGYHMSEEAGNEYQNETATGMYLTVLATQATYEKDSKDDQYDKDAEYPEPTPVSTVEDLTEAVAAGENVILQGDLSLTSALNVSKSVSIDLNGKEVTAAQTFAIVQNGATLTLTGGSVESAKNIVAVRGEDSKVVINGGTYTATGTEIALSSVQGGTIIVNGGEFTANEFVCSAQDGGEMIINDGTFTANDNAVVATNGKAEYAGSTITINGGTFNGNIKTGGYIACGVYVANSDTVNINGGTFNITDGVGILMRAGNTTIGQNVKINLTNTGKITEGKVGDAKINIETPSYLVQDVRSGYPGATAGFTVTNNSSYTLVDYK